MKTIARIIILLAILIGYCSYLYFRHPYLIRYDWIIANDVAADGQGGVYVTGSITNVIGGPRPDDRDIYLARYDSDGHLLWTKQFGSAGSDDGKSVCTDPQGGIYVTGLTDGCLEGQNFGGSDAFLCKFDPDGNRIWTRQIGSTSFDEGLGVSADGQGSIYIAGIAGGDLGASDGGKGSSFLGKYNSDGKLLWTKRVGSTEGESCNGVLADGRQAVYVTGGTRGNLGGQNAGETDAFLSKFDADGNILWTKQIGTPKNDESMDLTIDDQGAAYIGGVTLGNMAGQNAGDDDVFLSKFDPDGNLIWTKQLGTTIVDNCTGVLADHGGNIYLTGSTWGSFGKKKDAGADAFVATFTSDGDEIRKTQFRTQDRELTSHIKPLDPTGPYLIAYATASMGSVSKYDKEGKLLWNIHLASDQRRKMLSDLMILVAVLIACGVLAAGCRKRKKANTTA